MNKIKLASSIELVNDKASLGEAFASVSLNPYFQWAKIVVTDDLPNANKHRVPQEEFDNIIKTGIFAPIKMAESGISRGHDEAMGKPIGTISQLTKVGNKVIALAALWKKERPDDIEGLKKMFDTGLYPNVSWELSYAESSMEEDVEVLHGISLNGLAVVSQPAYEGRTAIFALAEKQNPLNKFLDEALEAIPNLTLTDGTKLSTELVEQLTASVNELYTKIDNILTNEDTSEKEEDKVDNETLTQKIAELESEVETLNKAIQEKDTTIGFLQEFKQTVEKEKADADKLGKIKERFDEAGIEKDDTFWTEKAELLLGLEDSALEFMIQELVINKDKSASTNEKKVAVPNVTKSKATKLDDAKSIGVALRQYNSKK